MTNSKSAFSKATTAHALDAHIHMRNLDEFKTLGFVYECTTASLNHGLSNTLLYESTHQGKRRFYWH